MPLLSKYLRLARAASLAWARLLYLRDDLVSVRLTDDYHALIKYMDYCIQRDGCNFDDEYLDGLIEMWDLYVRMGLDKFYKSTSEEVADHKLIAKRLMLRLMYFEMTRDLLD